LKSTCLLIASSIVTVLDAEKQRARLMHRMLWSNLVPFGGLSERNMCPASTFQRRAASPHHSADAAALHCHTLLVADARSSSQPAHSMATPSASLTGICTGVLALLGTSMARAFPRKSDRHENVMFLLCDRAAIGTDRPSTALQRFCPVTEALPPCG
jgi:hypothetical protein